MLGFFNIMNQTQELNLLQRGENILWFADDETSEDKDKWQWGSLTSLKNVVYFDPTKSITVPGGNCYCRISSVT